MPDDSASGGIEQEHHHDSPHVEPTPAPTPKNDPRCHNAETIAEQRMASEIDGLEDRIRGDERKMTWLTGAIAFLGLCTVVVGILQWNAMRGQLAVMQKTLNEMKTGAEGSTNQTNQVIGNLNWNARAAQEALDEAKISNEKIRKQTQTALDASIKSARDDQRSWLSVRTVTLARPLKLGDKPTAVIEVINSGKSPAIGVTVTGTVLSRQYLSQALSGPEVGEPDSRALVGPSVPLVVVLDASEVVSTQGQIDAIVNGSRTLYATGTIYYSDVFKAAHWTKFCFRMGGVGIGPDAKIAWGACARGNSTDDSKP